MFYLEVAEAPGRPLAQSRATAQARLTQLISEVAALSNADPR
jgi:hypothetical protein